jgi:hypothetical protein
VGKIKISRHNFLGKIFCHCKIFMWAKSKLADIIF